LKTSKRLIKKVEREIEVLHSYNTPVILALKPIFLNKKSEAPRLDSRGFSPGGFRGAEPRTVTRSGTGTGVKIG
jgi:hypothetical protein